MTEGEQALQLVRPLLIRAGLPAEPWSADILSRRNDREMHRVIVKLSARDHAPLVAKLVFRPRKPERFETTMLRQIEVSSRMPDSPRIHGFDAASQVVLMDFVAGETLYDLCFGRPAEEHMRPLESAGRWVDAFHRSARWESRQFQPRYTLTHLEKLRERLTNGALDVPRRPVFLSLLEQTLRSPPEPSECQTVAAINHGDLNLRNILVHDARAAGLDFGSPGLLPVAHDLARLFCHYGALCVAPGAHDDGPLPGIDLRPFFDGYKLAGEDDATVAFLCRVRLLGDWRKIPKAAAKRSVAQRMRLRGILALADRILE